MVYFIELVDDLCVEDATDSDWAGRPFDRKSTTKYFLGRNLVNLMSKKQPVAAQSPTETGYTVIESWLR